MTTRTTTLAFVNPKALILALGTGLAAAALASPGATPALAAGAAAQGEVRVNLGGTTMAAADLIGKPVMLKGERIGQVKDLIGRDNTYNDVLIMLDEPHSQMGLTMGASMQKLPSNDRPVIVGGKTIAVPFSALSPASGGAGLELAQSAVITLDQFSAAGGNDYYLYSQRR